MIRAMIVDDERPSLQKLKKQLADSGLAEVTGMFTDPLEALAYLSENKADAVFLDIEMPDMDGIELANRILDLQGNISIVFVTAYNQYAVEAFRLNALDYLLKPVAAERLGETLDRISKKKGVSAQTARISAQCFGKFCVKAGEEEVRFRTEKAEELLAYLIHCRGDFVSRSKILDSLWEDFDGDRANANFNATLHYVKKALLPCAVQFSVLYDRGSYRLNADSLDCDYLRFSAFMQGFDTATRQNISACEEAAALYTGEYLSGRDYAWAAGRRLLLEEQFIGLLLGISEYYRGAGDFQKAAQWLKDGLLHEPLHRELNYRLIELLLLRHEQALASRYYDLYKTGLAKKLGLEPDAAFQKLLGRA